jgi:amphi-Trp domain-containing protein
MPREKKKKTSAMQPRKSTKRDIEKVYDLDDFADKLRRLADAIEGKKRFVIQIAGERIFVPARAIYNIEHERAGDEEEIEFQIKWKPTRSA